MQSTLCDTGCSFPVLKRSITHIDNSFPNMEPVKGQFATEFQASA